MMAYYGKGIMVNGIGSAVVYAEGCERQEFSRIDKSFRKFEGFKGPIDLHYCIC